VTLSCRGPAEVHLSGYFEPKGDDMDDDMFYGQENADDDEDEGDSDDEDIVDAKAKQSKQKKAAIEDGLKQAQVNSQKNSV